ncbi:MAG: gliding motility lipoprotein GldD, partial [Bacteroidales bacterium]
TSLRKFSLLPIFLLLITCCGCRKAVVPRPKGYFRIDFPARQYLQFNGNDSFGHNLPLSFEYPAYGKLSFQTEYDAEPGWFDIDFPHYKARIYLTYKEVKNDLENLMDQSYKMDVKNHITKADAINENMITDPEHKVFGILYDLKGNTATAVQFFATDSVRNFFRGSLYFAAEPNPDSLAPSIAFFREDIVHMIETLRWKEK